MVDYSDNENHVRICFFERGNICYCSLTTPTSHIWGGRAEEAWMNLAHSTNVRFERRLWKVEKKAAWHFKCVLGEWGADVPSLIFLHFKFSLKSARDATDAAACVSEFYSVNNFYDVFVIKLSHNFVLRFGISQIDRTFENKFAVVVLFFDKPDLFVNIRIVSLRKNSYWPAKNDIFSGFSFSICNRVRAGMQILTKNRLRKRSEGLKFFCEAKRCEGKRIRFAFAFFRKKANFVVRIRNPEVT